MAAKKQAPAAGWRRIVDARWPWVLLLLVLAAVYYGSYVRYNIGFRDEGQTVAFDAQRLLQGEVPLRDVVLNYNVLWFYPVVALFKCFGVSYVLLRGYCLALSALTATLTLLLVARATGRAWLGFLVALIPLFIPGSPFKNYIPLLAVANACCLLDVALCPAAALSNFRRVFVGALVLGISLLIRIDIAMLAAAVWIGLLLLRGVFGSSPLLPRLGIAVASLALLVLTTAAVHWPVWIDAKKRGFANEFLEQYREKGRMLSQPFQHALSHGAPRPARPAHAGRHEQTPHRTARVDSAPSTEAEGSEKGTLTRASLKQLKKSGQNSGPAFLFLTYAPIAGSLLLLAAGLAAWIRGLRQGDEELQQRGLGALAVLGAALATFPQFFFFRPDIPHLSEFMPGYLAAFAAGWGLLWAGEGWWRFARAAGALFFLLHVGVYVYSVGGDRWAGTAAVRAKRTKFFTAENGVRVYVSGHDQAGLLALQKLLRAHAPRASDYVVCYPYSPGINLLSNRPTYEKNVYVDNAMHSRNWDAEAIARFQKFQPAVIVLSDWEINGTKASRFSVWAVRTKTWIQAHYTFQGAYAVGSDSFEVYTRSAEPPAPSSSPAGADLSRVSVPLSVQWSPEPRKPWRGAASMRRRRVSQVKMVSNCLRTGQKRAVPAPSRLTALHV